MKRGLLTLALACCLATGLLRFELVAQEPSSTPSSTVKKPPAVSRELLRYDGKSFDEWRGLLQTELSPERRQVAVEAIADLGRQGYDREAAEALVQMLKAHADDLGASKAKNALFNSISAGIRRLDSEMTVALLAEVIRQGEEKEQEAAISICHGMGTRAKAAGPALLDAASDTNRSTIVRYRALFCATDVDRDAERLPAVFQESLDPAKSSLELRGHTLDIVWARINAVDAGDLPAKLFPLVVPCLDDQDENIRESAINILAASGQHIAGVLPELMEPLHRLDPEIAAMKNETESDRAARAEQRAASRPLYDDRYQILVEHAGLHSSAPLRDCFATLKSVERPFVLEVLGSVIEYKHDRSELRDLDSFFAGLAEDENSGVATASSTYRKKVTERLVEIGTNGERDVFEKLKAAKQQRERDSARRTR